MIEALRRYPSYKDSGLSWLGEIPEHWAVRRNKFLLDEINIPSQEGSEDLLTVSRYTGVTRRRDKISAENDLSRAASLIGYKCVQPGDIVMNIMLAWNGSLGVSKLQGITSPAYSVFRTRTGVISAYLHYLLRTPLFTSIFKAVSTGVVDSRLRLYPDVFSRIQSLVPPASEQSTIVRFLDYHDNLISQYIRTKRRQVALLNEQKQAIIQQAVTCGLDPDVHSRPSSNDLFGEVPEHWTIVRLKRFARLHRGYDLSDKMRLPGPYPVVSSAGIIGTHKEARVKGPGVVTGRYGSTGRLFFIESDYWPHNTALYVSDFCGNNPRYVFHALQTLSFGAFSDKSAVPGIDRKDLDNIPICVPPLDEQATITDYLDKHLADFGQREAKLLRQIELVREYRDRLIADVVTGKVDVREAAATLPETEESEAPTAELALDEEDLSEEMADEEVANADE